MAFLAGIFSSSIGKKILMALTGLFLCTYLIVHLAGNLLLLKQDGGAAFDAYAELLPGLLVIKIIEYGLYAVFLLHIVSGLVLWSQNREARPVRYEKVSAGENSSFFSRTMVLSGSVILIFLFFHMKTFWVTSRFMHEQYPSMYELARSTFASPVYSILYIGVFVLLAFHLRHGFQSAFQTFGLKTQKYAAIIEGVGVVFWLVIPLGFAIIPIYLFYSTCHWFH